MLAKVPLVAVDSTFPSIPSSRPDSAELLVQYNDSPPQETAGYAWDGRLGTSWFAGRVWTFDYPNRRLYFNGTAPTAPTDPACWVPLGFQTNAAGHRRNSFPRIAAQIDGDTIQFLLDTGAMTELTPRAWAAIAPGEPRQRATSFITTRRFEAWHQRHPDWAEVRDAEAADRAAMIRVPSINIGGRDIGPVWFTERPNASFDTFMSQYMDKPIEGALGGSMWRYVTLILDYPRARATVLLADGR